MHVVRGGVANPGRNIAIGADFVGNLPNITNTVNVKLKTICYMHWSIHLKRKLLSTTAASKHRKGLLDVSA